MKRVAQMIGLLSAIHVVVLAGFVGVLFASGRINREKLARIVDIVRETENEEVVAEVSLKTDEQVWRASSDRIEAEKVAEEIDERRIDRLVRDLEAKYEMLEEVKQKIVADEKQLAVREAKFSQMMKDERERLQNEGFLEAMQIYSNMPPESVKNLFMTMEDRPVMEYLVLMDDRARKKIIKKFQMPEELEKIKRVINALMNEKKVSLVELR